MVGGVGKVLCFQTKGPVPRLVHAIEMIGGVQLDAGLRGVAGHPAAGFRIEDPRRQLQSSAPAIDDKIVVVALRPADIPDPLADGVEGTEVDRKAGHGGDLASRDHRGIRRGVLAGLDLEFVSQDIPVARARQVEIGVVGQVHHGRPVRLGAVSDEQLVLVIPRVRHGDVQMAGVAFLTIDAAIAEFGDGDAALDPRAGTPELRGESLSAAMDMITSLVGGDAHLLALQREPRTVDPIGVAADDRGGGQPPLVGVHRIATEDDVGRLAAPIRHLDRRDRGPVLRDPHRGTRSVLQGVQADRTTIRHPAEVSADHRGGRRSARSGTASHPATRDRKDGGGGEVSEGFATRQRRSIHGNRWW